MKKSTQCQYSHEEMSNSAAIDSAVAGGILQRVRFLLSPTPEFLQQKYRDHRRSAVVIIAVCSFLWAALWGWDLTVDSAGATNTLGLRMLFIGTSLCSLAFIFCKNINDWLASAVIIVCLISEANFIEILNRLHGGMVYGLAGFMYCMLVAVLLFQCFSLRVNLAYTVMASILPHIAGILGFVDDFPHLHYATLIWPAAFLTGIAQTVQGHDYLLRYQLERQLKNLSNTDPLTGVKNRRYFIPLLRYEIRRAVRTEQGLSLLLLDIDDFKNINDRYGHPTGDSVIRRVAEICGQVSREIDIVARIGGEEFAVLLVGSALQQATSVAERIRETVSKDIMMGPEGVSIHCTVSIGIAEPSSVDEDELSLFSRADTALYKAKEAGRNKVVAL